jgi:putative ABC transport system permease protein
VWTDLRLAARVLLKSPAFVVVAVVTLSIGIAATASMFALVNGLVLDPLPYPHPDRIVQVWHKNVRSTFDFMPLTTPDYLGLRERVSHLSEFGVFSVRRYNLGGDPPESIEGALCTAGLLRALNVQPLHGRWFTRDDENGNAALVILSYALWERRFGADPGAIGRTIRLDGREHTIVGVMPADFQLLSMWTRNRALSVWTLMSPRPGAGGGGYWLASIARVKPGVSIAAAEAQLREVGQQIARADPGADSNMTFWLMPLSRQLGGLPALRVSALLGAGWALLALAAQGVAGMLLARGLGRQTEMAIRAALGARRARIARLAVADSLLLSFTAGACGLLLTLWCLKVLPRILPVEVLPRMGLHVDGWLVACIVVLTLIVTHMAGTAPALLATKTDSLALRESGAGSGGARRVRRKMRSLVIGQVMTATILVSLALQLSGTYRQMVASAKVAASDRVLTAAIAAKGTRYDEAGRTEFWKQLLARTAVLPGVRDAAVTTKLPFDGGQSMTVLIDDEVFNAAQRPPWTEVSHVSASFFPAIGASLYQGRYLNDADGLSKHQSVVINRAMAERYWPGHSPIGHRIRPAMNAPDWSATIVGVIADLRQVAETPAKPEMYFSCGDYLSEEAFLIVRTLPGVTDPTNAIRRELQKIDPDLALAGVRTMEDRYADGSRVFATITAIIDSLTVAILGLAALGLYGTLSFHFAQRRREIGVRMAMGAHAGNIVWLVLRQALVWVAVGGAIGMALSWALAMAVRTALQDATMTTFSKIAGALAVVTITSLAAAYWPARRTAKVDPMVALRCE